jgi:large subunit ribosomal protein L18
MTVKSRNLERDIRHARLRRKLSGTAQRPRLHVFKSHKNLYLQVIDDVAGATLASVSTQEPGLKSSLGVRGNVKAAKTVGTLVAQRAIAKGVKQVVFDRGGQRYQGVVKTIADAAREAGLEF